MTGLGKCIAMLALSLLSACASDRKLDKPIPLQEAGPIASAADERLSVTIGAVIVRGGPGAWSTDPNWDEYLLHFQKLSPGHMAILQVAVVDSLGKRHGSNAIAHELEEKSEETVRRYKDANLQVRADAGDALMLGGYALGTASSIAGLTTTSAAVSSAAVAGAVVAPVLMTAGIVLAIQEAEVQGEMTRRATKLPLQLTPEHTGRERALHVFVPIAPAPQRVEVEYADGSGMHVLVVDTRDVLAGLHLPPAAESQRTELPSAPESTAIPPSP
jgi:hypothetical protein